jgi:hypothetical protein
MVTIIASSHILENKHFKTRTKKKENSNRILLFQLNLNQYFEICKIIITLFNVLEVTTPPFQ